MALSDVFCLLRGDHAEILPCFPEQKSRHDDNSDVKLKAEDDPHFACNEDLQVSKLLTSVLRLSYSPKRFKNLNRSCYTVVIKTARYLKTAFFRCILVSRLF